MNHLPHGRVRPFLAALGLALTCALTSPLPLHAASAPSFTLEGGGWGHGIGMTQYGARGYALKGWKYDAIVKHYFSGTRLRTMPTYTVKVNLDNGGGARSAWLVRAGGSTPLSFAQTSSGKVRVTLDSTKAYWVTTSGSDTLVRKDVYDPAKKTHSYGDVVKRFDGGCVASAGGLVQLVGNSGPYAYSGIRWRGTIRFNPSTSSTSKAINYVDLEQYLYGVVPRESPSYWPAEALKAQAVVARSYAYQDAKEGRTLWCTTRSQVYNGVSRPGYTHETAATNAAVDATKGRVVWYGSESKPVKTYFSSSSGGHTADIEDVWIGATPKPYYKGVTDADQDNPNYAWKKVTYSAAALADKIRDYDNGSTGRDRLDYSVGAPATVTRVTCERAPSGHTHHAVVTWSNGKTFRLTGDKLRAILGVKSTRFKVTTIVPPTTTSLYEESSSRLAWFGPWNAVSDAGATGGSLRASSTRDSAFLAQFKGTGIVWAGPRGPKAGRASVYLDGVLKKTVDLGAPSVSHKHTLFKAEGLKSGTHTLKIVVTGQRGSGSTGTEVAIDRISVLNGTAATANAPLQRYEQNHTDLVRLGSWGTLSGAAYSGGSAIRTATKGARLYATFYGSEIRWVGTTAPSYGTATVRIDGGAAKTVKLTSSKTANGKVVFSATGLAQDIPHTIMIEASGTGGTKGMCAVDGLEVRGGWLLPADLPAERVQQSDSRVRWSGTWSTSKDARFSGGTHKWTRTRDAECVVTFEGTSIQWVDKRAKTYGKVRVFLDGVAVGTVDQFSASSRYAVPVWSSAKLSAGRHTLRLVSLRSKRDAATDYTVGVDAFVIKGRAVKP